MAKYRRRPLIIEATQWFKNGDHPRAVVRFFPPSWSRRAERMYALQRHHGQPRLVRHFER